MLGKNNAKVRYQQTAEKTTRFTLKKLNIGLVSAVAGATLLLGNPVTVDAQDLATEQVTETTYYLKVDAPSIRISSAYTAVSKAEAEAYFKQYVWENGERGLEWSFDESSSTFYASKGQGFVENPVQDPVVDEPVVEEPVVEEPAVQETTFTLIAENPTTNLTTEYTTADVQEAELYFRNYVNENGLGHLEWTYDSATATFYASPAQQVEQPVEETPEVDEEAEVVETTYTLVASNNSTDLTTSYTALDAQEAELYFRNYVNENGLGDLEWTFDAKTSIFYASPAEVAEEPVDETPEVEEPGVDTPGTEVEATEYTARYELRDENWQLIDTLQESVYRGWDSLEEGSIVVAESLVDQYGNFEIVVRADGLVFVFFQEEVEEFFETTEDIPFETVYQANPDLDYGARVTVQEGQPGQRLIVRDADGQVVSQEVITAPINEIIDRGNVMTRYRAIPFYNERVENPRLPIGVENILVKGHPGHYYEIITHAVNPETGELYDRTVVGTIDGEPAVNRVTEVGTGILSTEAIPFETIYIGKIDLDYGDTVVAQEGQEGERTILHTPEGDLVSVEVTKEPVNEIVHRANVLLRYRAIPFYIERVTTVDLPVGEERVVVEGNPGHYYEIILHDVNPETGELYNRTVLGTQEGEPAVNRVIEVGVSTLTTEEIPYETVYQANPELNYGARITVQEGQVGERTLLVSPDGEVVSEDVTLEPVSEVIDRGNVMTRRMPIPFYIERVENPELAQGLENIIVQGNPGHYFEVFTYDVNPVTGEFSNRTFVEEIPGEPAVNRVIEVGTRAETTAPNPPRIDRVQYNSFGHYTIYGENDPETTLFFVSIDGGEYKKYYNNTTSSDVNNIVIGLPNGTQPNSLITLYSINEDGEQSKTVGFYLPDVANDPSSYTIGTNTFASYVDVETVPLDQLPTQPADEEESPDDSNEDTTSPEDGLYMETLIISEIVEGSGNNKAIELYNGTGQDVQLSDYSLELYANGNTSPNNTENFNSSGVLAHGETYVLVNSQANAELSALGDQTSSATNFNGDDAIVLYYNGQVIDSFGQIGAREKWNENVTLVRRSNVTSGDTTPTDAFKVSDDWIVLSQDDFSNLGSHSVDL